MRHFLYLLLPPRPSFMQDMIMNDPREVRRAIRRGEHSGHTAGLAPGYVQGNVCILPREYAEEFVLFCERNPKPCPLLAASQPGEAQLPTLGEDLDIRTDVPRYRVFRDGEPVADVGDIRALWREDLVAFVLGCSFSFEQVVLEARPSLCITHAPGHMLVTDLMNASLVSP